MSPLSREMLNPQRAPFILWLLLLKWPPVGCLRFLCHPQGASVPFHMAWQL